jgi:hypothetical protein
VRANGRQPGIPAARDRAMGAYDDARIDKLAAAGTVVDWSA